MARAEKLEDHERVLQPRTLLRRARLFYTDVQRGLRDVEATQILMCALLGGLTGAVVATLRDGVALLHSLVFAIPRGSYLSTGIGVSHLRLLFVPALGGLLLGVIARYRRMLRSESNELVDPIEANALYGGRMSLRDSIWLAFTTVLSNGAGASLGMEAGFSQLGAAIYSRVGQNFRLRRSDLRIFVTAGAGAAIAAAFNAPLAGAFYGFELVLGSYNVRALAPVIVATVCGALTQRSISHMQALFEIVNAAPVAQNRDYFLFALLGLVASAIAILAMQTVSWVERGLRNSGMPNWLRPAFGGVIVSFIAFYFPQVLGSGHGAIQFHFENRWALATLVGLLIAKLLASGVSVGSGFRGGLFSSSLFLGTLLGAVFAQCVFIFAPSLEFERATFMLAGMGAVAAAVVGAPLTMVFLVLEGTGDFLVTIAVVISVTISASIARMVFGYSFATWRFHLRGLAIRGAHDVGWIADMNVARLMRSDPKCVRDNTPLEDIRRHWPAGSAKRLYVVTEDGRYAGSIDMGEVHDREIDDAMTGMIAADLASKPQLFLLPFENVRTALTRFDATQTEDLPVLDSVNDRKVVGYMTEAYALKRYAQEMERTRSAELGERDLFSLGPTPSR